MNIYTIRITKNVTPFCLAIFRCFRENIGMGYETKNSVIIDRYYRSGLNAWKFHCFLIKSLKQAICDHQHHDKLSIDVIWNVSASIMIFWKGFVAIYTL